MDKAIVINQAREANAIKITNAGDLSRYVQQVKETFNRGFKADRQQKGDKKKMEIDGRLTKVIKDIDADKKDYLLQLFIERQNLQDKTDDFINMHTDDDGKLSKADADKANKQIDDIEEISKMINKELDKPAYPAILPELPRATDSNKQIFGVSGKEYKQDFLNAVRNNFSQVQNYLQVASPEQGGYLVPSEMHESIIVKLRENNILRQISNVIQTASQHKITIQATRPTAQWTPEGSQINLSSMTFDQKSLDAYKLTVGISISNEVKADSYYNLEQHIINEFSAAMGELEEETFFTGDGNDKPTGLLNQLSSDMTISTAGSAISADDLISLVHTVPRPYRKNGVFVMSDETLAAIRKLKDSTLNYLWGNTNLMLESPETLLGYRVYTTPYLNSANAAASGKIVVLFGDFQKFIIGQRGQMTFRPLFEIHALQDLSTYLMLERVDAVLTDDSAIAALKLK